MTKIGENNHPSNSPNSKFYHKDLETHLLKFEKALGSYTKSQGDERTRLQSVMDDHLTLIQSAASEIMTQSIHKFTDKLTKDYHDYLAFNSDEHFAAVKQDLQTIRECNEIYR
ncbi:MAG TPA: hypothetical protein VGO47_06340, partial [Chlamydiales bacterium]|nr:hypothetical protein [Chlamydiales bacterium]